MRDPDLCAAELCELSTNIFFLKKASLVNFIYGSHYLWFT
jgi:hypothetical protein